MRKLFKKPLVYTLLAMLSLPTWLLTGIINASHAKAAEIINENFNNFDGTSNTIPSGWTFSNVSYYSSSDFSGLSPNSIKFDDESDHIVTPQLTNTSQLSFWIKGSPYLSQIDVSFVVLGYINNNWELIGEPSIVNEISQSISYDLPKPYEKIEFLLQSKNVGNVALDDVIISDANIITKPIITSVTGTAGTTGETTSIIVTATDDVAPTKAEISFDNGLIWEQMNGAASPFTYDVAIPIDSTDPIDYLVRVYDEDDNVSDISSETIIVTDNDKPVISLVGEEKINVEIGSNYNDLGATAVDDVDGDITANISTNNTVNTAIVGDYEVKYDVFDAAGNNADQVIRTVHVVWPELINPSITVDKIEQNGGKSIKVYWKGVGRGVTKYEIYVNGVTSADYTTNVSSDDTGLDYSKEIKVLNTGVYNIYVKAWRGDKNVESNPRSVEFVAPPEVVSAPAPAPVQSPVPVSVAPQKAQAEEPQITTPTGDENGQIKGDESASEEEEKINWTPWIVLFVLIILAGAATGGYFYWFSGEEEITEEKKPAKKVETVIRTKQAPKKSSKKPKRW